MSKTNNASFTPVRMPGLLVQAPALLEGRLWFERVMVLSAFWLFTTRVWDKFYAIDRTYWTAWHLSFLMYDSAVYALISNRTIDGRHVLISPLQEIAHRVQTNLCLVVDLTSLAMHISDMQANKYGANDLTPWLQLSYLVSAVILTGARRFWMQPRFGQTGTTVPSSALRPRGPRRNEYMSAGDVGDAGLDLMV